MSQFERAIGIILVHEGGYVDDPHDPGGKTKWGISQRSYPGIDIASLTKEDAKDIYRRDWWNKYHYDLIVDQHVANKIFDLSVNCGAKATHTIVQRTINNLCLGVYVSEDGVLGPKTREAINKIDPETLLLAIKVMAGQRYIGLGKPRYVKGWLRRCFS